MILEQKKHSAFDKDQSAFIPATHNCACNRICILWEADMRWVPLAVILLLIAMQSVGNAQDQGDLRNSLQGCINDAVSAGNFDKARMGQRGTLVVRCTDQLAREMYMSLGRGVPERNVTFPNRDKGAERKFGLSMCFSVKEKADGTPAAEFSCRIAISVGAAVLELF